MGQQHAPIFHRSDLPPELWSLVFRHAISGRFFDSRWHNGYVNAVEEASAETAFAASWVRIHLQSPAPFPGLHAVEVILDSFRKLRKLSRSYAGIGIDSVPD